MAEKMTAVLVHGDAPLVLGDVKKPDLKSGEVLVRVAASGLNRADLLQRRGMYPPPPGTSEIMGLECAGEIVEIGQGVTGWNVGDRVCALLAGGGYAEFAAVDAGSLLPVPDGIGFTEAACLPEAILTVWANVYDRCAFQPGEAFLVHGGTSGIGIMAVQMARVFGASHIFATAGSDEKCARATELGATRAINYRTEDFETVVTSAGGADVVLDMVGGDYVQKNISLAKVNGRIVNIAYMNGPQVQLNLLPLMLKRLVLTATTLRARPVAEKARLRAAAQERFWGAVEGGEIKPILDTVFPASEAEAAHALMTKGGHIGKIVLEW